MRLLARLALATLAGLCLTSGCSSTPASPAPDPTANVPEGCDPLVPEHCGFPFPNNLWLSEEGGKRHLALGPMLPPVVYGAPIDAAMFADRDGFSPGEEVVTYLAGATATGRPTEDTLEASLAPGSPTVLLDTETGERVPHFAELDAGAFLAEQRSLLLHPVIRLKDAHRYVVAIRGVVDDTGKRLAPSPAFRALQAKTATKSASFEARRAHFEELFATLEAAGVHRADLQLAWDYTTASRDNTTRDMITMRDDALAQVGELGPEYTITNVELAPNPYLAKRLTGLMTVPLYLDRPDPGGVIVRDAQGLPKRNGTAQYEFIVLVPKSATDSAPAPILQNGHGLLGRKTEGIDGYFADMCNQYDYVGLAVDWVGLDHDDVNQILDATTKDLSLFKKSVDRQHQGFINALLAMRMMKGRMKDDPNLQMNGKSILDPSKAFYRGDSQGGIFGTTYMSISTDVTRGLLGEPGMPYNLILDRSIDFSGYRFLLKGMFPNVLDVRLVEGFLQILWDRTEPNGYAPYMVENMLPGTPAHRVLIHTAIGDHQVSPLGAHVIARTVKAKNLSPLNRSVWGIDATPGPVTEGSAMVEYFFNLPEVPKMNLPPHEGDDPHDTVRKLAPSMAQVDEFFRTGVIRARCTGPCDPE